MGFGNSGEPQVEQSKHVEFCSGPCHAELILQTLNTYRQSGLFTDVVLLAGTEEFPCHRATLSANSAYFRAMFHGSLKESRQDTVKIPGISPCTMETLLNFMYEGKADIQEESVEKLFQASDLLQVTVLRDACVEFLEKRVNHSNCLGILGFARSFFIQSLSERCQALVFRDFAEVCQHEEFLLLSQEELAAFLSSEQLAVEREEIVLEAVLKWVHHDAPGRKGALKELLGLVRLPLLDPVYFFNKVETDDVIQDSRECRPLLLEARKYHVLGNEVRSPRTHPRSFTGLSEIIAVIGGCDKKGFTQLSFTEKYNPETTEWVSAASIPGYSKSEFAACTLQNDIYISGGHYNSSDVWRYVSQLDTWVRVASLIKGRWRHKMAALQGRLYAVGGFDGLDRMGSVERYSSFSNEWLPVAPLLEAVSSAALVSCGEMLYLIGGAVNDFSNTNKVQCYDPVENQWAYVSPAPFTLRCINAVSFNGTIYVMGGLMDKIYSYSPKMDVWSEVAMLPGSVESCGVTVCNARIYILGGRDKSGIGIDRVHSLDPSTGELTEEPPMSRCVSYHGCVTITQHVKR
ncbi:kelch-like protein 35 [Acipenser oxyrinchus oxyrinchus]|uniref:Kelch-like protein 35 n=1 Tax=Acipenser oxyrinchus oxyrinchus TaxID=40147 RepID=A0AAD8DGP1_ACIOX|nr:kelch-like protein 35 [Acipenser oxyrinchus oxyrinchus]